MSLFTSTTVPSSCTGAAAVAAPADALASAGAVIVPARVSRASSCLTVASDDEMVVRRPLASGGVGLAAPELQAAANTRRAAVASRPQPRRDERDRIDEGTGGSFSAARRRP